MPNSTSSPPAPALDGSTWDGQGELLPWQQIATGWHGGPYRPQGEDLALVHQGTALGPVAVAELVLVHHRVGLPPVGRAGLRAESSTNRATPSSFVRVDRSSIRPCWLSPPAITS